MPRNSTSSASKSNDEPEPALIPVSTGTVTRARNSEQRNKMHVDSEDEEIILEVTDGDDEEDDEDETDKEIENSIITNVDDDEEPAEDENVDHPLLNSVVISTIFSYLKLSEIETCRLVCRTWCSSGVKTKLWKEHFFIQVKPSEPPYTTSSALSRCRQFCIENDPAMCKNFTFSFLLLDTPETNFWESCCQWMTILVMDDVEIKRQAVEAFQKALFQLMPNLTKLSLVHTGLKKCSKTPFPLRNEISQQRKLTCFEVQWNPQNERLPFDWKPFFARFPMITTLSFRVKCVRQLRRPLKALVYVRETEQIPLIVKSLTISKLNDTNSLSRASFRPIQNLLQTLCLPLESIYLDTAVFRLMRNVTLSKIFQCHSATLKKIHLDHPKNTEALLESPMPALESITVSNLKIEEMDLRLVNAPFYPKSLTMNLLRFAPKLAHLEVDDKYIDNWGQIVMVDTKQQCDDEEEAGALVKLLPNNSVTSFTYNLKQCGTVKKDQNNMTDVYRDSCFVNFTKLMPNVTVVEMPLDNVIFRLLCRFWSHMQHITVLREWMGYLVDDEGITGIRKASGKKIWNHSISNLKQLKSFKMNVCNDLTNKSIEHGFLLVPTLKQIELNTYEYLGALSETVINKLEARVDKVIITRCGFNDSLN